MRRKESRKDRIFWVVMITIWTVTAVPYHVKADDVIPRSAAPRMRVADNNQDLHIAYCGGAESVAVNDATLPRPIRKPELDKSLREARARMNAHIQQTWDYLTTRTNLGQLTEAWKQGQADQHSLYNDQALKECTKRCVSGVAEGTLSLESGMACLAECQEQSALYQRLAQCTKGYTNETKAVMPR
jgi:hypothetical protein